MPAEATEERWLNSGRDRPKKLTVKHWSYLLALIVHGAQVRFTEEGMLEDLHACVGHAHGIKRLADLDQVTATHWCWAWEMRRPDLVREIERRREEMARAAENASAQ